METKVLPYSPKVDVIWVTPNPLDVVSRACSTNMRGMMLDETPTTNEDLPGYLFKAGHGTPLEHAVICMDISCISRACLDQLRTHRIGSFSSSSQHYQDHRNYNFRVSHLTLEQCKKTTGISIEYAMREIADSYAHLMDEHKIAKEDARMLLPMATESRILWTVNARSLVNFLTLRLCYRNVTEMVLLACQVYKTAYSWFPELFCHVKRECYLPCGCRQGKMKCDMLKRVEELYQYEAFI